MEILPVVFQIISELKSLNTNYHLSNIQFLVLDQITDRLPTRSFNKSILKLPDNVVLADQSFNTSQGLDILLGVTRIFYQCLSGEPKQLGEDLPILQTTKFGWILAGSLPNLRRRNRKESLVISVLLIWKTNYSNFGN